MSEVEVLITHDRDIRDLNERLRKLEELYQYSHYGEHPHWKSSQKVTVTDSDE